MCELQLHLLKISRCVRPVALTCWVGRSLLKFMDHDVPEERLGLEQIGKIDRNSGVETGIEVGEKARL